MLISCCRPRRYERHLHHALRMTGRGLAALIALASAPGNAIQQGDVLVGAGVNCAGASGGISSSEAIMTIDPTTGDRSVLSGAGPNSGAEGGCTERGTGPTFSKLTGSMVLDSSGAILVPDGLGSLAVGILSADGTRILRVDPISGDRSVVSGCDAIDNGDGSCIGSQIGAGPAMSFMGAVAIVSDEAALNLGPTVAVAGDLFASASLSACPSDFFSGGSLIKVDPATGDRTILSGEDENCAAVGAGDPFQEILDFTLSYQGILWVVDFYDPSPGDPLIRVIRVDAATGDRIVVSGCTQISPSGGGCTGELLGAGPTLDFTQGGLETDPISGKVLLLAGVSGCAGDTIVEIDPSTGHRTVVSGLDAACSTVGTGTNFIDACDLAVSPAGNLFVAEDFGARLLGIDSSSGARSVVSGCLAGGSSCDPPAIRIGNGPQPLYQCYPLVVPEPEFGTLGMTAISMLFLLRFSRRTFFPCPSTSVRRRWGPRANARVALPEARRMDRASG